MNPEKLFDYPGGREITRASRLYRANGEIKTLNQQSGDLRNSGDVLKKTPATR